MVLACCWSEFGLCSKTKGDRVLLHHLPVKTTGRSLFAGSTVLLAIFFLCSCTTTVNSRKSTFDKAHELATKEMPEEARRKISNLSYPELISKGNEHLRKGNSQLSRLHFAFALQKNPDSVEALTGLGILAYQENKVGEAGNLFSLALEQAPENARAMLYLGKIAREQADLTTSLHWLNKAAELRPEDPEIVTELAITNDTIGQEHLAYAEPLYRKVIELRPNSAAAHNNLGFNLLLQGRYAEAIEIFAKALAIAPQNARTKNNLATTYLLNNEKEKALALYEGSVGKAAAYNNLGYIYMTQGNWDQAEKAFKTALAINPVFYTKAQQNLERLNRLRSDASR
jgi:Flp pilus assembly protein TadD